jgi:hypothetical protein
MDFRALFAALEKALPNRMPTPLSNLQFRSDRQKFKSAAVETLSG